MDLTRLAAIIQHARTLPSGAAAQTIFTLGARAYYENPTSDLLAFFLDPSAAHGMRDLFLRALLVAANMPSAELGTTLVQPPEREVVTATGNRIDIILRGDAWTAIIENKIYAGVTNPLADYVEFIERSQSRRGGYCAPHYFILLSAYKAVAPLPWRFVGYGDVISAVEAELGRYFLGADNPRWLLFAREFLVLLRSIVKEGGMDEQHRQFVEDNYADVRAISRMRSEYYKWILTEGARRIAALGIWGSGEPTTANNDWGDYGQALRYYPRDMPALADSNVTLVVKHDGALVPHAYFGGQAADAKEVVDARIRARDVLSIVSVDTESRGRVLVYKCASENGAESGLSAVCAIAAAMADVSRSLQSAG